MFKILRKKRYQCELVKVRTLFNFDSCIDDIDVKLTTSKQIISDLDRYCPIQNVVLFLYDVILLAKPFIGVTSESTIVVDFIRIVIENNDLHSAISATKKLALDCKSCYEKDLESCRIGIERLIAHNRKENGKKKEKKLAGRKANPIEGDALNLIHNSTHNVLQSDKVLGMVELIRYIGQNSIDSRATKKTKECDILSTIGRRRVVNSDKYGEKVVRFAINTDGHCLFDSLAFLFLYYGYDTGVVNYELLSYGWMPCLSGFLSNGTCKGNLMEVLVTNHEKFVEAANLNQSDSVEALEWFHDYSTHIGVIEDENYPSIVIVYIVFRLLFKNNDVQLCMHQLSTWGNKDCYLDATGFVNSGGVITYLPLSTIHLVNYQKKVHLWNCDDRTNQHFEPVLPHDEQKEVNVSASGWIVGMKERMRVAGIEDLEQKRKIDMSMERELRKKRRATDSR
jgi:hypothetical protein